MMSASTAFVESYSTVKSFLAGSIGSGVMVRKAGLLRSRVILSSPQMPTVYKPVASTVSVKAFTF